MSIAAMSIANAVDVWAELEDALRGENGYGGDTAEIYAFRLIGHRPALATTDDEVLEQYGRDAWEALLEITKLFQERRNCTVLPDQSMSGMLTHRVHVQVVRG